MSRFFPKDAHTPSAKRKRNIVTLMQGVARPIWMGDLNPRASEQCTISLCLRSLVAEGRIERCVATAGRRAYYRLRDQ